MRSHARPILGVDIDNVLAQSDACLRAMFQELYGITLVTSRNPESKAGTEYWLRAKGLPYDQLHFNDDKHALGIPYHAFIEDRHEHAHRLAETGTTVYLL